jgi:hypothetical protein
MKFFIRGNFFDYSRLAASCRRVVLFSNYFLYFQCVNPPPSLRVLEMSDTMMRCGCSPRTNALHLRFKDSLVYCIKESQDQMYGSGGGGHSQKMSDLSSYTIANFVQIDI